MSTGVLYGSRRLKRFATHLSGRTVTAAGCDSQSTRRGINLFGAEVPMITSLYSDIFDDFLTNTGSKPRYCALIRDRLLNDASSEGGGGGEGGRGH